MDQAQRYEREPRTEAVEETSFAAALWRALPAIGMPVLVLGGILAGVFSQR